MDTRVSVIIPAYNAGQYVERSLASIEAQTRKPNEVIVIDDGSTDGTGNLVKQFSGKSGLRIVFGQQENKGPGAARNRGIKSSSGDIIVFLDADDTIYPDFLESVICGLEEHERWIACFSDRDVVNRNGELISKDLDHPKFQTIGRRDLGNGFIELMDEMLFSKMLAGSVIPMTIACRRADVEAVAGFDEDIWLGQDKLFMLRMIKRGTFGYVNRSLGTWQRHDTNLTHESNSLRRFPYTDLGLQKLMDDKESLMLTARELAQITITRAKIASQWVYAASDKHSTETFPLAFRLLCERRISLSCFTKAMVRYFVRSIST